MTEEYERFEHNGYTVVIHAEEDTEHANPRDASNVGTFVACNHRRYILGDAPDHFRRHAHEYDMIEHTFRTYAERGRLSSMARYLRVVRGCRVTLPVYLYDHGGLSVSTSRDFGDGGWDSGLLGVIVATPKGVAECLGEDATDEQITAALESEIHEYDKWLTGDVWRVTVEDVNGDEVESCGGYLGLRYAREAGREMVPSEPVERLYEASLTPAQAAQLEMPEPRLHTRLTAAQMAAVGIALPTDDED